MTGPEIAARLRAARRDAPQQQGGAWITYLAIAITAVATVAAWFAPKLGTISGGW